MRPNPSLDSLVCSFFCKFKIFFFRHQKARVLISGYFFDNCELFNFTDKSPKKLQTSLLKGTSAFKSQSELPTRYSMLLILLIIYHYSL